MAGLSALGMIAVWISTPKGLKVAPLLLSSWVRVLTDWRLLMVLMVTLLLGSGQTAALASRLDSLGFTSISAVHDLSRHDRFLFASAPPETP